MELKELRKKAKDILANFIDEIGLDGEFYASTCNSPIAWGKPKINAHGEFMSPNSEELDKLLKSSKCDKQTEELLKQKGLILINESYKQGKISSDLLVTLIHETLHANRNLLLFDSTRDGKNEDSYSFNNGKFEQNTNNYTFSYADASQEVLKGNIDTSNKTINGYENKSSEELENMDFAEGKRDSQMEKQQIIDEALVELISVLSCKLYSNKEKGISTDIWKALEEQRDVYEGEDIGAMCKIILRHHDFELFNWMIDPISYSGGDIHYDFFGQYTKDDQDLLQELYEAKDALKINMSDMEEVATSEIALGELPNSWYDIKKAQENEISK